MKINILEAKNRLSELIQSVLKGEEIVIAKRGNPVARLVPIASPDDKMESQQGMSIGTWLTENPLPEHLKRNHEEIESAISIQRDSWD